MPNFNVVHHRTIEGEYVGVNLDRTLRSVFAEEIVEQVAQIIAKKITETQEIEKLIDRDALGQKITEAIGKCFVERLLGKEKDAKSEK